MALTVQLPPTKVKPFHGFVETTGDALRLIQAARQGLIPRITRRLTDLERRAMIKSGAIFVFNDEESGIKRWTEGLSWSASRIVGNFLVYREVTEKSYGQSSQSRRPMVRCDNKNATRFSQAEMAEQKLFRSVRGCLSDFNKRFKPGGLIKKTITVNASGTVYHLIAYCGQEDVRLGRLPSVTSRPDILGLEIPPELLESTKFRIPPVTFKIQDGRPRYICDGDDNDYHGHDSSTFLSMRRVPLPQEIIPHRMLRAEGSVMAFGATSSGAGRQMTSVCPFWPHVPPSSTTCVPPDCLEALYGLLCWPGPFSQRLQPDNMDEKLEELHNDARVSAFQGAEPPTSLSFQYHLPLSVELNAGPESGAETAGFSPDSLSFCTVSPSTMYDERWGISDRAPCISQISPKSRPSLPVMSPANHFTYLMSRLDDGNPSVTSFATLAHSNAMPDSPFSALA